MRNMDKVLLELSREHNMLIRIKLINKAVRRGLKSRKTRIRFENGVGKTI